MAYVSLVICNLLYLVIFRVSEDSQFTEQQKVHFIVEHRPNLSGDFT